MITQPPPPPPAKNKTISLHHTLLKRLPVFDHLNIRSELGRLRISSEDKEKKSFLMCGEGPVICSCRRQGGGARIPRKTSLSACQLDVIASARVDGVWEKDLKKSGHFTAMSGENTSLCSVPSLPLSPASLLLRPGLTLSPG